MKKQDLNKPLTKQEAAKIGQAGSPLGNIVVVGQGSQVLWINPKHAKA